MRRSHASLGRPVVMGVIALAGLLPPAIPASAGTNAQGLPDYWSESSLLVDTPGTSASLAAGLFNPAAWPMRSKGGLLFAWQELAEEPGSALERSDWLGVLSLRGLSFGMRSYQFRDEPDRDWHWEEYTVGLGGGSGRGALGVSYSWSDGPACAAMRGGRLSVGQITRWRRASLGLAGVWTSHDDAGKENPAQYVQADLGLRPIGPRLTLFVDAVWAQGQDASEIRTGYGLEYHPVSGLALAAKALNTGEIGLRLGVGLGDGGHANSTDISDNDDRHVAAAYVYETGSSLPELGWLHEKKTYPELELKGPTVYRRYRFFDDRRTLLGTLRAIDAMATDPGVGGVVVNLSGMRLDPGMTWELRQQLAGLRAHGKKVIAYCDETSMPAYFLASVADQIWMDPEGLLEIQGIAVGRTYLRDTLEKLGIGFDEWRFFTYKSAYETFSRTSLSEADREQLGAIVDEIYETIAGAVTTARGIGREDWDRLIDERAVLIPREAQAAGLVDSIGTYEQAKKAAAKAELRPITDPLAATLGDLAGDPVWAPMEWGEPARIAVLYAIGPCEMDGGINARVLSRKIKEAREDRRVKAVLLRADSPGGSALASDLVARELKETAEKKPVIVSQGFVAGSGGYWISMYGDSILAAPITITGSIGVIGGWFWDQGLGEKLGIAWDGVWRGAHADLGQGMTLPLLGAQVPERPLSAEERQRMEELIRGSYAEFVAKVAEGRGMSAEDVDRVGQGRIWSGRRGREIGLVDELGGLWHGLRIAKAAAGIDPALAVALREGPAIGSFDLGFLRPRLLSLLGVGGVGSELPLDPRIAAWEAGGYPTTGYTSHVFSEGERTYLETLLRAKGRPTLMMEPLRIHMGAEGARSN